MVYNAMKLFMEINPQLFDDCSHDYTELQNTADQRQQARASKWQRLVEQARERKDSQSGSIPLAYKPQGQKVNTPLRIDEVDPMTQDSQRKLDALRIQDESTIGRDQRRPRELDRQNSVSHKHTFPTFLPTRHSLTPNSSFPKPPKGPAPGPLIPVSSAMAPTPMSVSVVSPPLRLFPAKTRTLASREQDDSGK